MRRTLTCVFTMLWVLGVALPGASAAPANVRTVDGALSGAGGLRFQGCNGIVSYIGNGTFHAVSLGRGTYAFDVCVSQGATLTFDGTITLTTKTGAALSGIVSGSFAEHPIPTFDVAITGGTQRFRHARGELTVGPLNESQFQNCDPRTSVCLDWHDDGAISGTVRHVG